MPSVTFTLTDTPTGGVAVKTAFSPAIGAPCSPAQAAAMDIITRTRREWGMRSLQVVTVDIDAVHLRAAKAVH